MTLSSLASTSPFLLGCSHARAHTHAHVLSRFLAPSHDICICPSCYPASQRGLVRVPCCCYAGEIEWHSVYVDVVAFILWVLLGYACALRHCKEAGEAGAMHAAPLCRSRMFGAGCLMTGNFSCVCVFVCIYICVFLL